MFAIANVLMLASDAHCRAIGSVAGVLRAIAGAMQRHKSVAKVQEYGRRALAMLAHDDGAWPPLCAMVCARAVVEHVLTSCSRLACAW